MIEVEKKFQPTKEALDSLLKDAEFIALKINHDIYYDYPDYRLLKEEIRFRLRNNKFELKIKKKKGVSEEIENEEEIKKYFKTEVSLKDFISKNLIPIMEYKVTRREYKKGEFTIDLDEMDFGYNMCEIEILVDSEDKIKEAEEKIIHLAKEHNIEHKKMQSKRGEYLKRLKPEVYDFLRGKGDVE